jgi:hypothetical protein
MSRDRRQIVILESRRLSALALVVFGAATSWLCPSSASAQAAAPWLIMDGPSPGYIEVPHAAELNPETITVEAWLYMVSGLSYTGSGCPSIVGKAYTESYWLGICGNRLRFYSHGGSSARDSTGQIPIGEWAHVAVTYDGSFMRFFINGELDSEFEHDRGPMPSNTQPLRIGSSVDYDVRPHAAIDEVRLWDVARSESDIMSTMNDAISSPMSGLVAAWNLDGDGADSVGGFDGAPVGEAVFGDTPPSPNPCIREYFIPAAAHSPGSLGTQWATDVSLLNLASSTASVDVFLLPRDTDNSDPESVSYSIDPTESLAIEDIVFNEFREDNLAAGLRICSDEALLVDSRTFNSTAKAAGSTFGQGVPGEDADIASTGWRWLIGLYESDQFRTNVGFVNASPFAAEVIVELYARDGTYLGDTQVDLPPYGYKQLNRVFTEITDDDVENGSIRISSSGSPIIAYASVVDNSTGDGTYKRAR